MQEQQTTVTKIQTAAVAKAVATTTARSISSGRGACNGHTDI